MNEGLENLIRQVVREEIASALAGTPPLRDRIDQMGADSVNRNMQSIMDRLAEIANYSAKAYEEARKTSRVRRKMLRVVREHDRCRHCGKLASEPNGTCSTIAGG